MYYKLSNTADRERMEDLFGVRFKYPNLYYPEVVINGLNESNLPIITSEEPDKITLAIWGILPEHYQDDWDQFQSLSNTLNIDERNTQPELWQTDALKERRCLILVTGFFTTYLRDGIVYPYYVSLKSGNPFFLAGIYNILDDGFITCSLLLGKANDYIKKFQNVVDSMPLVVKRSQSEFWLDRNVSLPEIKHFLTRNSKTNLHAHPIAKEFFNQNISYDSMLQPYEYDNIPFEK